MPNQQSPFSWPKLFSASILSAAAVAGVGWSVMQAYGNQIWAPKAETAAAIQSLTEASIRNEILDDQHHNNADLHMSEVAKRQLFVTRPEWEAGRNEFRDDMSDIKALLFEQRNDIKELLKSSK